MTFEVSAYLDIAIRQYRGTYSEALGIVHTVPAARQLAAEMAYIYENNAVPEWAIYIESFEYIPLNDSYIFQHHATA